MNRQKRRAEVTRLNRQRIEVNNGAFGNKEKTQKLAHKYIRKVTEEENNKYREHLQKHPMKIDLSKFISNKTRCELRSKVKKDKKNKSKVIATDKI